MKKNGRSLFWWMEISTGPGRVSKTKCGRAVCRSVGMCVQGLSSIAPDRRSRSGRLRSQKMRPRSGTTMVCVTWRHVSGVTRHVPPRKKFAKQYWLDQIFERKVAETRNFQGRCTPLWYTCHVSDDSIGSKLCPQGTFPFFSVMPSSSDTLRAGDNKFGTGGAV